MQTGKAEDNLVKSRSARDLDASHGVSAGGACGKFDGAFRNPSSNCDFSAHQSILLENHTDLTQLLSNQGCHESNLNKPTSENMFDDASQPEIRGNYHGILEVDMAVPKRYLAGPLSRGRNKHTVIRFSKRRIGYIQLRVKCQKIKRGNNIETTPHQVASTEQLIDVTLLRVRDIAFILGIKPDIVLDHVVSKGIPNIPPTDFMKSVYSKIYDPVIQVATPIASSMNYNCPGIMYDHMIHLEHYLRVLLPVSQILICFLCIFQRFQQFAIRLVFETSWNSCFCLTQKFQGAGKRHQNIRR